MTKLTNPVPLFLSVRGTLVDAGKIYVGAANADPEMSPVQVYWDAAFTIPAAQPLRVSAGRIVNGSTPAFAFVSVADYSIRTRDADDLEINYVPSTAIDVPSFQPLDTDLTAIAGLATTSFGRNLLTLANTAALKSATGTPDAIPLTGGTVSGDITRSGSGAYRFNSGAAFTSGRTFFSAVSGGDPTSQPGDIWFAWS